MENKKPLRSYLLLLLLMLITAAVVIGIVISVMPQKAQEPNNDFIFDGDQLDLDESTEPVADLEVADTSDLPVIEAETITPEPEVIPEPAVKVVKTVVPAKSTASIPEQKNTVFLYDVDPMDKSNQSITRVGNTLRADWKIKTELSSVSISYSLDQGQSWQILSENEPKDSFYLWQVPETTSTSVIVKVSAGETVMTSNALDIQQPNQ